MRFLQVVLSITDCIRPKIARDIFISCEAESVRLTSMKFRQYCFEEKFDSETHPCFSSHSLFQILSYSLNSLSFSVILLGLFAFYLSYLLLIKSNLIKFPILSIVSIVLTLWGWITRCMGNWLQVIADYFTVQKAKHFIIFYNCCFFCFYLLVYLNLVAAQLQ